MKQKFEILLILFLLGCTATQTTLPVLEINTGNGIVNLNIELAITPEQRTQGLMLRENLPENQGMLFVFEQEQIQHFWMKNTKIPLDIIFLNKEGKIVNIANAVPCTNTACIIYNSEQPAQYVLEVNAEKSTEWNLEKGLQLIEIEKIKELENQ
ncbi:MAG: DUF192 domain-containing protein [Candidatus Diapherotrites archaeon]|nr:DUF192 domain-containing protein [Candidatus Diapherotrites archaeon]